MVKGHHSCLIEQSSFKEGLSCLNRALNMLECSTQAVSSCRNNKQGISQEISQAWHLKYQHLAVYLINFNTRS